MKNIKSYYKKIDLIRVLACLSVLLYHMNILKGGYLAVCTFFVLSGYFSCISCFKKKNFSLKEYYFNKFLRVYLPLVIVVFISIGVISLFANINWFNLKPETTSVLFGYNNFWQLSANLDYFARHVNSPFMHLWYIAIILQFDLVFPFIYLALRKISDKVNKKLSYSITILLAMISFLFFWKTNLDGNIMITYYNTFARIFSLLFGVAVGFIHSYYGPLLPSFLKKKHISNIIFYIYLFILIILSIFVDAKSTYFSISMIIVTFITCRLLDYGVFSNDDNLSIFDKVIMSVSNISYEVYLIQYPIIFLFQYVNIVESLKIPLILLLTVILSYILHFGLNFKKTDKKVKVLSLITFIIMISISLYGGYLYCISKDHTKEMKELESKLSKNEEIMQKKQEEYVLHLKEEQRIWEETLKNLESNEKNLGNIILNLPVVGVGDSVMLGAINRLYEKFPSGYFDAKISRTAWVANGILKNLATAGKLGDPIILNLGANGDCPDSCKQEIMNTIGERHVFWLNVTNNDTLNNNLMKFASNYSNLHIVDWKSISYNHPEYFIADGIHLTEIGTVAFVETIYNSIYDVYLQEYINEKEKIVMAHNEKFSNKVGFIGNDILLNAFDYLQESFSNCEFIISNKFNYDSLKLEIENRKLEGVLPQKLVFAFDKSIILSKEEYQNLIELCTGCEIYILATTKEAMDFSKPNIITIDFYQEIISHEDYLMADKIHLTDDGNKALRDILMNHINYTLIDKMP